VRDGDFVVLVSEALVVEISHAPPVVQATFESQRGYMEPLETTHRRGRCARGGLPGCASRCRRQMELQALVQLRRIRGFHAVNVLRGYPLIEIRSPLEVIDDEA
jgi:hypothetical protein